jgi:uncharacterized membrane protein
MLAFSVCFSAALDHCHLLRNPNPMMTARTSAVKESQRFVRNRLSMSLFYGAR